MNELEQKFQVKYNIPEQDLLPANIFPEKMESSQLLNLQKWVSKNLRYGMFGTKSVWRIFKTAKKAGKSWSIAIAILDGMLKDKETNAIVLRKSAVDHNKSTMAVFEMIFNLIYNPENWNEPDFKKWKVGNSDNWKHIWKINKSQIGRQIINIFTRQEIIFLGFNNPNSLSGVQPSIGSFKFIWLEEPIMYDDRSDLTDQQVKDNFYILLNSAIRGFKDDDWTPIYFVSYNPWYDETWITTEIFEAAAFYDNEEVETFIKSRVDKNYTIENSILDGWIYENDMPDEKSGQGIYVLGASPTKINDYFSTYDKAQLLDEYKSNPKKAFVSVLGLSADIGGDVFIEETLADIEPINEIQLLENCKKGEYGRFDIGIDWGKNHALEIALIGFKFNNFNKIVKMDLLDNWTYLASKYEKKEGGKMKYNERKQFILKSILQAREKWNIPFNRFSVYFESSKPEIISDLNDDLKKEKLRNSHCVRFLPCLKMHKETSRRARQDNFIIWVENDMIGFNSKYIGKFKQHLASFQFDELGFEYDEKKGHQDFWDAYCYGFLHYLRYKKFSRFLDNKGSFLH